MFSRWSQEEIAMEILSLFAAGEPLNYRSVLESNPSLLRAGCRHFGSWRQAVEFAGLSYDAVRRYRTWTRARILARIQELHRQGVDLSWRNISTQVDPKLAAAATKPNRFGSWRRAIQEAGLDYNEIRRYQEWSKERVIHELTTLAAKGELLNSKDAQAAHIELFAAAIRRFASWDEALKAAGLNTEEIRLRPPFRQPRKRSPRKPKPPLPLPPPAGQGPDPTALRP
jgi:DNA-binding protein H-NS